MLGNHVSSLIPCFLGQVRPKESQGTQEDRRQIPRPLPLAITQVKKIHKINPASISLYSQHFIFSLLPTFSSRFLPPPYIFAPISPSSLHFFGHFPLLPMPLLPLFLATQNSCLNKVHVCMFHET